MFNWLLPKQKDTPPTVILPPPASRVEIELHKGATQEAAQLANTTNKHLTELLVENGFTLKIYLAAGGHQPTKRSGNKKK